MPLTTKPADDDDDNVHNDQGQEKKAEQEREKARREAEKDRDKAEKDVDKGKAKPKSAKPDPAGREPAYQPSLPYERDPDKAWQDYAVTAISGLYPNLRNGLDYAVGRKSYDSDIELLSVAEQPVIDWGKVEEAARRLAESDPYLDYKPKQSLAPAPRDERPERDRERHEEPRPKPRPPQASGPGPDPHFNPDGTRKNPV